MSFVTAVMSVSLSVDIICTVTVTVTAVWWFLQYTLTTFQTTNLTSSELLTYQ